MRRASPRWLVGDPLIVGVGRLDAVVARPRELLRAVLTSGGNGFVLAHNHVIDTPPSEDDSAVTRRLVIAGAVLGLPLLGHVVIGSERSWVSLPDGSWRSVRPAASQDAA